jgi:hypothetical protein
VARAALTEAQAEEDKMFWETYDNLTKYLAERTNCSVVRCPTAEGDDIIARWIALHPQDEHIVISSDTDFVQLVAPNVKQYNGITDELITIEGIFDAKGKPVNDKKTKEAKNNSRIRSGYFLKSVCEATAQTMSFRLIRVFELKEQKIKLVSVRPLKIKDSRI